MPTTIKLIASWIMLLVATTACSQARDAIEYGGWRRLRSIPPHPKFEAVYFVMLPGNAKVGDQFMAFDFHAGKTVCCMEVASQRLLEHDLEATYEIPGVWITDLKNDWGVPKNRPYDPHIYEVKRTRELVSHEFDLNELGGAGGLLLGPDAVVSDRHVQMGDHTYKVSRTTQYLANDDAAIDIYMLTDTKDPSLRIEVDVPFGTY